MGLRRSRFGALRLESSDCTSDCATEAVKDWRKGDEDTRGGRGRSQRETSNAAALSDGYVVRSMRAWARMGLLCGPCACLEEGDGVSFWRGLRGAGEEQDRLVAVKSGGLSCAEGVEAGSRGPVAEAQPKRFQEQRASGLFEATTLIDAGRINGVKEFFQGRPQGQPNAGRR
jgi:hypothetical protein